MTCSACKKEFRTDKTGFVICPYCGYVNVPSQSNRQAPAGRPKPFLPKKLLLIITVVTITGFSIIGAVSAYSIHTKAHHKSASVSLTKLTKPKLPAQSSAANNKPAQNQPAPASGTPVAHAPVTTGSSATAQPSVPTLDQTVASINQRLQSYGVTATLTPPNNTYTYSTWSALDSTDANLLNQFSTYLIGEFTKYPTDLVMNSGLKTIGLVKNLQVSGGARAAAPAPSITGMLYDVKVMTNAGSAYAREVVSHEYWHYLDYKMRGSYTYDDPQWDACNPSGFTYGSGGASAYGADSCYVAAFHPTADFITAYSEYSIAEDRAEMFGWLIYSPSSVKNLNDGGINCKINELTAIVHQLSPSMSF